jgi:putative glutamine amidotransferase
VKKKILIGITDCSKYTNYEKWILEEPRVEVLKLGYREDNFSDVKKCDGILLTGGEDVCPQFYSRPEYLKFCETDNMDEKRDEFEWKVMEYSQQEHVPVLGICRGLQITNVFFGGTLVPDLPSFSKNDHTKLLSGKDRYHQINIEPHSQLNEIVDKLKGEVNSSHHQSADKIGKGLVAAAYSEEGVVEAIERKSTVDKSFLLLVQWHPERMEDQESPLVKAIKLRFLEAAGEKREIS